jgi:hypothetical protein
MDTYGLWGVGGASSCASATPSCAGCQVTPLPRKSTWMPSMLTDARGGMGGAGDRIGTANITAGGLRSPECVLLCGAAASAKCRAGKRERGSKCRSFFCVVFELPRVVAFRTFRETGSAPASRHLEVACLATRVFLVCGSLSGRGSSYIDFSRG